MPVNPFLFLKMKMSIINVSALKTDNVLGKPIKSTDNPISNGPVNSPNSLNIFMALLNFP